MLKLPIFALLLLLPVNAAAFVLYTTPNHDYLRWHRGEVVITLDDSLKKLGPRDEVERIITGAFDTWLDKTDIPLMFAFERGKCSAYVNTSQSCIMACDDKSACYDREGHMGASTFLHFLPNDGRITGVSIVFNAADWYWSSQGIPVDIMPDTEERPPNTSDYHDLQRSDTVTRFLDLRKVSVHEIGHLLGIDHSENTESIMYYSVALNDTSISRLHEDDIDAAEILYSESDQATIENAEMYSGCIAAMAGRSPAGSIGMGVVVVLLLGLSFLMRRENRRAVSGCLRRALRNRPRRSIRHRPSQHTR